MMLRPSVLQDVFFGDLFPDYVRDAAPAVRPRAAMPMKTDVKELENGYELDMDLPGYAKNDITAELRDGYLVVAAEKTENKENEAENGKYIRRERYTGKVSRSFYVGKKLKEEDITASFADGVLRLVVPKEDAVTREDEKKLISIL